jgi:hypothetical protein
MAIILVAIGLCFIGGYSLLLYYRLLLEFLLMDIVGYFINGYCWLLMVIVGY